MDGTPKGDFVRFSDIWQRRGFMNMPEVLRRKLFFALACSPKNQPPTLNDTAQAAFRTACERWIEGSGLTEEAHHWSRVEKCLPEISAVNTYRQPTIDDVLIRVDAEEREDGYVLAKATEQRWSSYPFAFAVYWALFFHVETAYLERPQLMWAELLSMIAQWREPAIGGDRLYHPVVLALYERTLGLYYDQAKQLDHYVINIMGRPGPDLDERVRRVRAFDGAIHFFLKKITKDLTQLASA